MALELTHHELTKKIKEIRENAARISKHFQYHQKRAEQLQRKAQYHQQHLVVVGENDKMHARHYRSYNYCLTVATHAEHNVTRGKEEHDKMMREIEDLEIMKGRYLSPISSQPSQPIALAVRMLFGEMLEVTVDRAHPIAGFADQFAKQHGYQECVTDRMVFLHDDTEKEDVFWSPQERHVGKSIGDVLADRTPMLNLFIRSVEDPKKEEKIITLRKLLHRLTREVTLSDDALFDLYSNWFMTSDLPSTANRYQKMMAFIEAHHEVFPLIELLWSEEQTLQMADHEDLLLFRTFRSRYRLHETKPPAQHWRSRIENIFARYGRQHVFTPSQITCILYAYSMEQLFAEGVTYENFPTTWRYRYFVKNWADFNDAANKM